MPKREKGQIAKTPAGEAPSGHDPSGKRMSTAPSPAWQGGGASSSAAVPAGGSHRPWSVEERRAIYNAVVQYGTGNMDMVCAVMLEYGRGREECMSFWREAYPGSRGAWTPDEDELLRKLVDRFGASRWAMLATHVPGRNPKQCRERWVNILDPSVSRAPWTPGEDKILVQKQAELSNQWSKIATFLPGRPDNSVKNRWYCLKAKADRTGMSLVDLAESGLGGSDDVTNNGPAPSAPAAAAAPAVGGMSPPPAHMPVSRGVNQAAPSRGAGRAAPLRAEPLRPEPLPTPPLTEGLNSAGPLQATSSGTAASATSVPSLGADEHNDPFASVLPSGAPALPHEEEADMLALARMFGDLTPMSFDPFSPSLPAGARGVHELLLSDTPKYLLPTPPMPTSTAPITTPDLERMFVGSPNLHLDGL